MYIVPRFLRGAFSPPRRNCGKTGFYDLVIADASGKMRFLACFGAASARRGTPRCGFPQLRPAVDGLGPFVSPQLRPQEGLVVFFRNCGRQGGEERFVSVRNDGGRA